MRVHEVADVYQFLGSLREIPGPPDKGAKFHYALGRNMARITSAMNEVRANNPIDEKENHKYEVERIKLLEEHCARSEDDKPIVIEGVYQGLEGNEEFKAKLDELNESFKDFIDLKTRAYSIELKIEFFKVLPEYLPPSMLADDIDRIAFMVREN